MVTAPFPGAEFFRYRQPPGFLHGRPGYVRGVFSYSPQHGAGPLAAAVGHRCAAPRYFPHRRGARRFPHIHELEKTMTPIEAAQQILSIFVGTQGARVGRTFSAQISGGTPITPFPGTLQKTFLQAGGTLSDLSAGLSYAVSHGWLSLGRSYGDGTTQDYVLEQAGFAQAGGAQPTPAQSAQQLLKVCAAINPTAGSARFSAEAVVKSFVGTAGGITFAPEDLIPGLGYALSEGWVRSVAGRAYELEFSLTAAGVAQAP